LKNNIVTTIVLLLIIGVVEYFTKVVDLIRVMWLSQKWNVLETGYRDQFLVGVIIIVICLCVIIHNLISAVTGRTLSQIKKYLKNNPVYTMEDIEADLTLATKHGKNLYLGRKWIIESVGFKVKITPLSEIIWAYYYEMIQNGVVQSHLRVYQKNKKMNDMAMKNKDEVVQVLEDMKKRKLPIVLGYSKELMKMFRKDFEGFIALAKQSNQQEEI
jgi:hypothetical protein